MRNQRSCAKCGKCRGHRGPWAATHILNPEAQQVLVEGIIAIMQLCGESTERISAAAREIHEHLRSADSEYGIIMHYLRRACGLDAVVIKGVPIDFNDPHRLAKAKAKAAILASAAGHPFQYAQQNDALVYAPLRPKGGAALNSNASNEEFLAHSDDAIVPESYRCREIWLVGEHNIPRAATGFAQVDEIKEAMDSRHVKLLSEPDIAEFGRPPSHGPGLSETSGPRPIFWTNKLGEFCVSSPTYRTMIRSDRPDALEAFEAFKVAASKVMRWIVVDNSSALVFRNDRGLHSRKKIDGDRSVIRVYTRPDLDELRAATGTDGHIFDLRCLVRSK